MTEFIIEFKNSIPEILCKQIIYLFEKEEKFYGMTIGGLQKNILDSNDFIIPKKSENWHKIETFLHKELSTNIVKYLDSINKYSSTHHNTSKFFTENFLIRKYNKNVGKYTFHLDEHPDKKRIFTFIWYLNTIENGGETEFLNSIKINPEQGKLLIFPSSWIYPHTSKIPISDDKYAIIGWIEII